MNITTLDKLYLEISQITEARTAREAKASIIIKNLLNIIAINVEPGTKELSIASALLFIEELDNRQL